MKNKLPCAVVRDLLPSYIENLTEEETTTAVQEHLEQCQNCRSLWETMTEGETAEKADLKEVDFLKTVRRKNRKKVVLSVLAAAVVVLGVVCAKLFLIGTPADSDSVSMQVTPFAELDSISISFINTDSAGVLTNVKTQTTGDVVEITAQKVLVSPVHPSEEVSVSLNLAGIREVVAFGKTIWQEDTVIDGYTHKLLEKKTPYVGNPSAVNAIICAMDLDVPHTLELHTSQEPYGLTIHFTDTISKNRRFMTESHACLLLVLVENLSEVYWDDPSGYSGSVTLTQLENALPELVSAYNQSHNEKMVPLDRVKDYGLNAYSLQVLRNVLGV